MLLQVTGDMRGKLPYEMTGGESIVLTLPKYSMAVEGPVFGITSSNAAFTTYATISTT